MDICVNENPRFTKWVVARGYLREPFVLLDVGVQGGEHRRWRHLGAHLVVHGFDAIREAADKLARKGLPNRHYHWLAVGDEDREGELYFNPGDPRSSSLYRPGAERIGQYAAEPLRVRVRRLDTLRAEGVIPAADFLKVDVEGGEKDVLLGARGLLAGGILAVESETNFNASPTYPRTHFCTLQEILLEHRMLVFDVNFDRIPREAFQRALAASGRRPVGDHWSVGKPSTLNVLFCRDPSSERDDVFGEARADLSPDQLVKLAIIFELHGLNDIAVDLVERCRGELGARFDADEAIGLLANPRCRRSQGWRSWRVTGPLRTAARKLRELRR